MTRFLFFCRGLSTAPGLRPDRPVQGQGQGQGQSHGLGRGSVQDRIRAGLRIGARVGILGPGPGPGTGLGLGRVLVLALILTGLLQTAPLRAQPLASDDAAADQLDAVQHAQRALEQSFARLAFDAASWQAHLQLCNDCQAERPDPKEQAPALPQDPLGALELSALEAELAAQKALYDQALLRDAAVSAAGLARYEQRCLDCAEPGALAGLKERMRAQSSAWADQRADCQAASAPRQYGGSHSWHLDHARALTLCQEAYQSAPNDPWAAFLLWRSQTLAQQDPQLLSYAAQHAVPPALAALAWQRLAQHLPARRLAEAAWQAGDLNGLVVLTLLERRDGASPQTLTQMLAPAIDADHPWALRLAAVLESSPALKVAYLELAIQQGDRQAQSEQLRAWEANLGSAGNRKLAARAHILAVAQGLTVAEQLWYEDGDQRPTRLVKALQEELIALGHLSGTPDGVWGKNSEAGLRSVSLAEVAAWQPEPVGIEQAKAASVDEDQDPVPSTDSAAAAQGSFDEAATSEANTKAEGLELVQDQTAADDDTEESVVTALVAPLPKPKGNLAIVEPEAPATPKKRGTVFKSKSD